MSSELISNEALASLSFMDRCIYGHSLKSCDLNKSKGHLSLICKLNKKTPAKVTRYSKNEQGYYTLATSVFHDSQLKTVLAYALSLACLDETKKVNILVSNEWSGPYWAEDINKSKKTLIERFNSEVTKAISCWDINQKNLVIIKDKIIITPISSVKDLEDSIKGIVIKFKGAGVFNCFNLAEDSIFLNRPCINATFSSLYRSNENADITLVRGRVNNKLQRIYTPPSIFLSTNMKSNIYKPTCNFVFGTLFTGERIKKIFTLLKEEEVDIIKDMLSRNIEWRIFGVSDIAGVISSLPKGLFELVNSKIFFYNRVSSEKLTKELKEMHAILCFPGIFGGGNTIREALSLSIPILCTSDEESDISNLIDFSFHHKNTLSTLSTILKWVDNPNLRTEYINRQNSWFENESDLKFKGSQLISIVKDAIKHFEKRMKDSPFKKINVSVFGDSHSTYFRTSSQVVNIIPELNNFKVKCNINHGASIKGLGKRRSTLNVKSDILDSLSYQEVDWLVLNFGQVDVELGIYFKKYIKNEDVRFNEYFNEIINSYVDMIKSLPIDKSKIIVKGINLPTLVYSKEKWTRYIQRIIAEGKGKEIDITNVRYELELNYMNDSQRTNLFLLFNQMLEESLKENKIKYFDINDFLVSEKSGLIDERFINFNDDHHIVHSLETVRIHFKPLISYIQKENLLMGELC